MKQTFNKVASSVLDTLREQQASHDEVIQILFILSEIYCDITGYYNGKVYNDGYTEYYPGTLWYSNKIEDKIIELKQLVGNGVCFTLPNGKVLWLRANEYTTSIPGTPTSDAFVHYLYWYCDGRSKDILGYASSSQRIVFNFRVPNLAEDDEYIYNDISDFIIDFNESDSINELFIAAFEMYTNGKSSVSDYESLVKTRLSGVSGDAAAVYSMLSDAIQKGPVALLSVLNNYQSYLTTANQEDEYTIGFSDSSQIVVSNFAIGALFEGLGSIAQVVGVIIAQANQLIGIIISALGTVVNLLGQGMNKIESNLVDCHFNYSSQTVNAITPLCQYQYSVYPDVGPNSYNPWNSIKQACDKFGVVNVSFGCFDVYAWKIDDYDYGVEIYLANRIADIKQFFNDRLSCYKDTSVAQGGLTIQRDNNQPGFKDFILYSDLLSSIKDIESGCELQILNGDPVVDTASSAIFCQNAFLYILSMTDIEGYYEYDNEGSDPITKFTSNLMYYGLSIANTIDDSGKLKDDIYNVWSENDEWLCLANLFNSCSVYITANRMEYDGKILWKYGNILEYVSGLLGSWVDENSNDLKLYMREASMCSSCLIIPEGLYQFPKYTPRAMKMAKIIGVAATVIVASAAVIGSIKWKKFSTKRAADITKDTYSKYQNYVNGSGSYDDYKKAVFKQNTIGRIFGCSKVSKMSYFNGVLANSVSGEANSNIPNDKLVTLLTGDGVTNTDDNNVLISIKDLKDLIGL